MSELIQGPAGSLQILEEHPGQAPVALAVICHPHPQHGGALTNKVVHQLARSFVELGAISVRFNFRGVGDSEGQYDEGRGELEDLYAVVQWARGRWPGLPLWLAGFSFGGFIALQGAGALQPGWLVTVAPAINYFTEEVRVPEAVPWLLVQGEADDIVPAERVQRWIEQSGGTPRLALMEGAGHFFHGRLNDLKQELLDANRGVQ